MTRLPGGKCSECGNWYYEKDLDTKGRWIPDLDATGKQKVNDYGRPMYLQHVHSCPKAAITRPSTGGGLAPDRLDVLAAEVQIVKTDVEICKQHLETIVKKLGMFESAEKMLANSADAENP